MKAKTKVWLEKNGEVFFGEGRCKLLEIIERTGSLNSAAKEMKMSYRAAWGKIKATEKRAGIKLIQTRAGGRVGGGSILTPEGKALTRCFEKLQKRVEDEAGRLCTEIFKTRKKSGDVEAKAKG